MNRNRAHVTSEWATGRVTVQVVHDTEGGRYLEYMAPPLGVADVPRLERAYVQPSEGGVAEESERRGHAPGFTMNEDTAVLVWEALDEYLHNTGQHPTKALQEALAAREEAERSLAILQERLSGLDAAHAERERYVAALSRAADREADTVDLERARLGYLEKPKILAMGVDPATPRKGGPFPGAVYVTDRPMAGSADYDRPQSAEQRRLDADTEAFEAARRPRGRD